MQFADRLLLFASVFGAAWVYLWFGAYALGIPTPWPSGIASGLGAIAATRVVDGESIAIIRRRLAALR